MGGDANFGHDVHFLGADLRLDRHAVGAEQHRMQRLVAIGLGNGDVVLEPAHDRLVQAVHHPQRPVAGVHRVHDNPHCVDVVDLLERQVLEAHFLVNAPQVLAAAHDPAVDAFVSQPVLNAGFKLADDFVAVAAQLAYRVLQDPVAHRVEMAEPEILQFLAQVVHAQPAGDGGIDVQGFAGDAAARFRAHGAEGAHVVQAVGQLDHDHPQVLGHGQEHLAEVFGLRLQLGVELDLGQLADPVHQLGDFRPEVGAELILVVVGVLNDVV